MQGGRIRCRCDKSFIQLGEVGGSFAQNFFVDTGTKTGFTLEDQVLGILGIWHQEEVPKLASIGELSIDGGER